MLGSYSMMTSLLCHLHYWTLKALSPGTASGGDIGTHRYHEKYGGGQDQSDLGRKEWAEGRGITWTPRNKKPEKLRDTLRECEELLSNHRPICMKWKTLRHCLVLLSNGTLLTFTVAKQSGDVERISIDKTLAGRMPSIADNALMVDRTIVLTLAEDRRPVSVSLSGRRLSGAPIPLTLTQSDSGKKLEKLSAHDPKFSYHEVPGMPAGLAERHLVSNTQRDLVAIWWRDSQDTGWQWTSVGDSGTHNILMFRMNGGKLEYVCGVQTEGDPVDVQFSKVRNHTLYTFEKATRSTYDCCIYEYGGRKLVKAFTELTVSSEANVQVCERNRDETKLLVGCDDGSLLMQDSSPSGSVLTAKAFFSLVSLIRWHPAGSFAFVCSPSAEIQCYDLALNPLFIQLAAEDPQPSLILSLGVHVMAPCHLELAGWASETREGEGHSGCHDNFIMVFDRGPVVVLRLELGVLSKGKVGPVELISEYLQHNKIEQAVALLGNMNWNSQPRECFTSLTFVMDHLLVQPLSAETEAQMETALASFLTPKRPMSRQVLNSYRDLISHLTRRMFHLLLRYRRLEKAFQLATDLAAKDLFMDVHFEALDCNEPTLAQLAKQKAESVSSGDVLTDSIQSGISLDEGYRSSVLSERSLHRRLPEGDEESSGQRGSLLSCDSFGSSHSPHLEQATTFESSADGSSVTASDNEEYSDDDATEEAAVEELDDETELPSTISCGPFSN